MLTGLNPADRRRMRVVRPAPQDRRAGRPPSGGVGRETGAPSDPEPQGRLGVRPSLGRLLAVAGVWARRAGPATLSSWAGYPPGLPVVPPRLPPALDRLLLGGAAGALVGAGMSATCCRLGAVPLDVHAAGAALAGAASAGAVLVLGAADPERAAGTALLAFSLQSVSLTPLPAGVAGATLAGLLASMPPPPGSFLGVRRPAFAKKASLSTPTRDERRAAVR